MGEAVVMEKLLTFTTVEQVVLKAKSDEMATVTTRWLQYSTRWLQYSAERLQYSFGCTTALRGGPGFTTALRSGPGILGFTTALRSGPGFTPSWVSLVGSATQPHCGVGQAPRPRG